MATTNQQVLEELSAVKLSFVTHCSKEEELREKIDAMYKVLVTGNGQPPLPETVRASEKWIKEEQELKVEKAKETRGMTRSIALLVLGQVIILLVALFR